MQSFSAGSLTIDLSRIEKNFRDLTQKVKNVMPMVKANAYGTDALKLAELFQTLQAPMLGVSHVNEAIFLRENGISLPIFVINVPPFDAMRAVKYDLDPALSNLQEAEALAHAASKEKKKIRCHVCINTGMNRFGMEYERGLELFQLVSSEPSLQFEGVMTHFSCSERPDLDAFTYQQIDLFKSFVEKLPRKPKWIHAANSFGAVRFDLPFCNLARIGLGLLKHSLSLESHLVAIRGVKKGECVGYNCQYRIQKDHFKMGVIPLGYHDGLHRHYSEKGFVLIHGKKAPMIGHICMDFMMVDLTDIPEAKIQDSVLLFNAVDLPPETFASWGRTDVRELTACLGPRIKRIFIKQDNTLKSIAKKIREHDRVTERLPSTFDSIEKSPHSGKCRPPS